MALQASAPENGFLGVVLYVDLKLKCVFTSHGPIWTRQNLVLGGFLIMTVQWWVLKK